jgi:WhiB family redox-sensing transcriptional regulator
MSDGITRLLHALDEMRPDWVADAACRGMDPALFFPERGESAKVPKAVCAGCPVQAECRDYGAGEREGVWGGLTAHDRRRLAAGNGKSRPIRHGTVGGYGTHRHRGEPACDECKAAYNAWRYARNQRAEEAAA